MPGRRDPEGPPSDPAAAWEGWQRPGLNQFRLRICSGLRAHFDVRFVLRTPAEVYAQPGLSDKILELGSGWREEAPFGPSREELFALVSAR